MRFLFLLLLLFSLPVRADNQPFDSLEMTEDDGIYSAIRTEFSGTKSNTVVRIWYPYPPSKVWPILIDTNGWRETHKGTYADTRTLDVNQYKLVRTKQPDSLKSFYELIGGEEFSSDHGRVRGGVWMSYVFQRFAFPFPLKDRWVVLKVKNDESGRHRYEYSMAAGNFRTLKGYWELANILEKPGWTEFRAQYDSDPGIQVPQFLAKSIFKSSIRREAKENMEAMGKK